MVNSLFYALVNPPIHRQATENLRHSIYYDLIIQSLVIWYLRVLKIAGQGSAEEVNGYGKRILISVGAGRFCRPSRPSWIKAAFKILASSANVHLQFHVAVGSKWMGSDRPGFSSVDTHSRRRVDYVEVCLTNDEVRTPIIFQGEFDLWSAMNFTVFKKMFIACKTWTWPRWLLIGLVLIKIYGWREGWGTSTTILFEVSWMSPGEKLESIFTVKILLLEAAA